MIHSDHGTQPTFQAFTRRAIDSDLIPSTGSVGDRFDNAVIESFWSRIRVELLDRKRWRTRVELANALFAYLEILYDRQQQYSALGMITPVEFEIRILPPAGSVDLRVAQALRDSGGDSGRDPDSS